MILITLGKMGFSIEDSKYISISLFNEMSNLQLELSEQNNKEEVKKATQSDIDTFF